MSDKIRKWVANRLVALAYRIYPQSESVMQFYMDRVCDFVISGQSTIKVSVVDESEMYYTPEK